MSAHKNALVSGKLKSSWFAVNLQTGKRCLVCFADFLNLFSSVVSHFSSLYGIEQRVKKSPSAESTDLPVKAASSLILTHRASKSALYVVTVAVWLSPLQNTISVKWVPFVRNLSTATTQETASPRAKCVTSTRTVLMEKTRASSVVRFCFCCFFLNKITQSAAELLWWCIWFDFICTIWPILIATALWAGKHVWLLQFVHIGSYIRPAYCCAVLKQSASYWQAVIHLH